MIIRRGRHARARMDDGQSDLRHRLRRFRRRPVRGRRSRLLCRAGRLPANLLLRYQGLGSLRYWNPALEQWQSQTPNDERIRLFGGLDLQTVVSTDRSHCGGLLICIPRTVTSTVATEGSTLFTDSGVQGALSLIVDNTAANGSLHAHLDWFLELPGGQRSGAAGAYLLELRLTADGSLPRAVQARPRRRKLRPRARRAGPGAARA